MEAVPLMHREMRRHFVMNCCLVATAVVGGIAITNERGVFSPLGFNPFSAYAQALGTIANPVRGLFAVPSATPLSRLGQPGVVPGLRRTLAAVPEQPPLGEPGFVPAGPFVPGAIGPLPLAGVEGLPGGFGGVPGFLPTGAPPGGGFGVPDELIQQTETPPVVPVPEPAVWTLMIVGFGLVGRALRAVSTRRRRTADALA